MRSIVSVLCLIVLVVAGIWWWRTYHSPNPYDGSVVRRDAAMEQGTTTMENGQNLGEEAHPTPSRSDAPGTINTEPTANAYDLGTETRPIKHDPYGPDYRDRNSQSNPKSPQVNYDANSHYYRNDTEPPAAPDGARFGGSGVYQWYRQGDLTYRVDTRNGSSCIVYATLEEWRKPDVYHHGCR